jgi:L-alanine-DL-glutamate epimerase-like enolase superfamily enzyme
MLAGRCDGNHGDRHESAGGTVTSRIDDLRVHTVRVPLLRPFVTAVRRAEDIDAVLVEVVDSDGRHGWGEAAASWRVTGESPASIRAAVTGPLADVVVGRDAADVPILSAELARSVVHNSAARSAVDCALYDIAAQSVGLSLSTYLGGGNAAVRTDMTISTGSTDELVRGALEHCGNGFGTLKIKVGAGQDDVHAVLAVREAIGADVVLRVDANQGWDIGEAVRIIRFWEDRDVNLQFVEQPVTAGCFDDLALVTHQVETPILADESVWTTHDLNELIARRGADLINVKLAKTGGITEALKLIAAARANEIGVMVGCMMESHVGIAAAAAIASTLSPADGARAQDLDAGLWLRNSPVTGGTLYRNDAVVSSLDPGLGITGIASTHAA